MPKYLFRLLIIGLFLMAFLGACNLPAPNAAPTLSSGSAAQTSAAETVSAVLRELPTATYTSVPGSTDAAEGSATITLTPDSDATATQTLPDDATFVTDVTIPDGTIFEAGETFTKTWRLRNTGESTWTTAYDLVFDSGDMMGGLEAIPLAQAVLPGEEVDLSVDLTAPQDDGQYVGHWKLRNADNVIFGVGPEADDSFFVLINVVTAGFGTITTTPLADGSTVINATLSVDQPNYSGACPIRINFTGVITSQGSGTFVYEFKAATNTPGFTFTLPGPVSANYNTGGTHYLDIAYFLDITDSVTGWAWIHILAPNVYDSGQANFSVTCTN